MKTYVSLDIDWEDTTIVYVGSDFEKAKSFKAMSDNNKNHFVIEMWENEEFVGRYLYVDNVNDFVFDR